MERQEFDEITLAIIQAAIEVHRHLGPGLLENIYQECLTRELSIRGLRLLSDERIPVYYKSQLLDARYQIDLLVEDAVIVELKAIETILPVHCAQVLTYLRLTNKRVGLLINFNVRYLRQGIRRIVNNF